MYQRDESEMDLHELRAVLTQKKKLNSLIPTAWMLREGKGDGRTQNTDTVTLFHKDTLKGGDTHTEPYKALPLGDGELEREEVSARSCPAFCHGKRPFALFPWSL